jgi:hypothetical protein
LRSAEEQRAVVDSATAPDTRPSAAGTGTATQQRLRANSSKSVAYPRAQTSPRWASSAVGSVIVRRVNGRSSCVAM